MADEVKPLVDVSELQSFQEDRAAVARALRDAVALSKVGSFKSREEAGAASDAVKELRGVKKRAEAQKLETTAKWRASTTHVNNHYKELLGPLEGAEQALKEKVFAFQKQVEAEEREQLRQEEDQRQKEAERAAADAQAAAELAEAEANNPEAQELADETRREAAAASVAATPTGPRAQPKGIRGSHSGITGRVEWKFDVVDLDAVGDEHKMLNRESVTAAMRAEVAAAKAEKRPVNQNAIPGILIYDRERPVSR